MADERGGDAVPVRVQLGRPPAADAPVACTLDAEALPGRLDEWQAALAHVTRREAVPDGVRLVLGDAAPIGELAALAAAERGCCGFFSFALLLDDRGPALEVRAPAAAQDLVHGLFGPPD